MKLSTQEYYNMRIVLRLEANENCNKIFMFDSFWAKINIVIT